MEKAIRRYWPVFVLPTLIAFIIGFVWPFIWGAGLSFCKFTTVKNVQFAGLSNYAMIWSDNTFTHAFWFTAAFTVVSTLLINVLAFAIALLLTRGMHGTNAFRTIFFLPNLIGGIVLGYIWQLIFNGILVEYGKTISLNEWYGFAGLVILVAWQQIGYMIQEVSEKKVNLYFGKQECLDAVKTFIHKPLNRLSPEEDFMLGAMLGYDISMQCRRYCDRKSMRQATA